MTTDPKRFSNEEGEVTPETSLLPSLDHVDRAGDVSAGRIIVFFFIYRLWRRRWSTNFEGFSKMSFQKFDDRNELSWPADDSR